MTEARNEALTEDEAEAKVRLRLCQGLYACALVDDDKAQSAGHTHIHVHTCTRTHTHTDAHTHACAHTH